MMFSFGNITFEGGLFSHKYLCFKVTFMIWGQLYNNNDDVEIHATTFDIYKYNWRLGLNLERCGPAWTYSVQVNAHASKTIAHKSYSLRIH